MPVSLENSWMRTWMWRVYWRYIHPHLPVPRDHRLFPDWILLGRPQDPSQNMGGGGEIIFVNISILLCICPRQSFCHVCPENYIQKVVISLRDLSLCGRHAWWSVVFYVMCVLNHITCQEESKMSEDWMGGSEDRSSHRGDHKRTQHLVGKADCKRPLDVNRWI